jgi:hypothetical protein
MPLPVFVPLHWFTKVTKNLFDCSFNLQILYYTIYYVLSGIAITYFHPYLVICTTNKNK